MATQDVRITPRATTPQSTGGCACCSAEPTGRASASGLAGGTATTAGYAVDGMTCGHCVGAVTEQLSALDGVRGVDVVLVAGGTSTVTVTSRAPLAHDDVAAAVDEAGYRLVGAPRG